MSKGSTQRPTDKAKFDQNFDLIFGKKGKTDNDEQTATGRESTDEQRQTDEPDR